ncbi:MAG: GntR family transcriptional regulator [Oscillospiraceae bacterium]|nr:GntR family transcriptional regulator [Oscillospiraceae bacterium]
MPVLRFKTLREEVVDVLRMKILDGTLKPGARIVEQEVAADLGISRGPIRESLRQLEQEGLIEYTRNVGCSVKEIGDQDIYEIYLLRATYEILAVKLCQGQFTQEALTAMKKVLEQMKGLEEEDFHTSIDYDNSFHAAIIHLPGLPRLSAAWTALNSGNIITYYAGSADHAAAVKRQYPIHAALYEACCTKDMQGICDAIMDHYMLTIRRRMAERGISETAPNYAVTIRL